MPRPTPQKNSILLAFACVYFFWGSTYGAIHIAGLYIAPPLVAALRTLLSTLILAIWCIARGIPLGVSRGNAWRLALVGVLFMSVNNVLLIWGETKVPSGLASLIIAMIPIVVALIETALPDGETLNALGWTGTLLGLCGLATLLSPALRRTTGLDARSIAGFAILTVAAIAFAVGSVLSRRFHFQVDTFVATTWQLGAASAVNFAIALAGGNLRSAVWNRDGILSIAYLAVFGSVVGLTAYVYLLKHVPVTKVATYAFVNPVIAVVIGAVAFRERLASTEILGMLLIIAAVATVIFSRTKTAPPPSDPLLEPPIDE